MTQQEIEFAPKLNDLNFIIETHEVEGKSQIYQVVLCYSLVSLYA